MTSRLPPLEGWMPMHLAWEPAGPVMEWCHLGPQRFSAPFFDQTVSGAMQEPFNLLFHHRTSMEVLLDWAAARPGIAPTGFIFHMSRCGSTLVSRMLGALPQNVVISEAPPVNTVLRAGQRGLEEAQRIAWLRGLMSALGQPRTGAETHFFVKFDNAHTLDLPLIRKAFPDVPWVFLHRDPVEVMVSQMDNRAPHMVPGMSQAMMPGVDPATGMRMPPAEYCARMLAAMCRAALVGLEDSRGLAVAYTDLPEAVWGQIAPHFGVDCSEADVERMRAVVPFHAKNPWCFFENDQQSKQKKASDEVRALCARWLDPLVERLRGLRAKSETPKKSEIRNPKSETNPNA